MIPDFQTLMLPVLKIVGDGVDNVAEIETKIAARFHLSDQDRAQMLPSNRQPVLRNRIHWAITYLAKAGLLQRPQRARYALTKSGRDVLNDPPDRIDIAYLRRFPGFDEGDRDVGGEGMLGPATSVPNLAAVAKSTPEEMIDAAWQAAHEALRVELLDRLQQNSPQFFERAVIDLLIAMGYGGSEENAAQTLGRPHDGGVDGLINEDKLGLDRIFIQAKRYASDNSIGRPDVQAFVGALVGRGASKGIFVTTSKFSPDAIEYVKRLSQRVILIDGSEFARLMIEHDVGVRLARRVDIKRIDEDFFAEN